MEQGKQRRSSGEIKKLLMSLPSAGTGASGL
jgi:hypothetical protein